MPKDRARGRGEAVGREIVKCCAGDWEVCFLSLSYWVGSLGHCFFLVFHLWIFCFSTVRTTTTRSTVGPPGTVPRKPTLCVKYNFRREAILLQIYFRPPNTFLRVRYKLSPWTPIAIIIEALVALRFDFSNACIIHLSVVSFRVSDPDPDPHVFTLVGSGSA